MPRSTYHCVRASIHAWCAASSSPGLTKYSISICSNSRVRNVKLPGVISLRNALPICATPNGSLRRMVSSTLPKLTKIPCAVSGRRYARPLPSPVSTAPTVVRNIRLNGRASVRSVAPHFGHFSSLAAIAALISGRPFGSRPFCATKTWSARGRALQLRQSVIGSENVFSWPEYFQTSRFIRIAASSPSMSSRS